METPKTDKHSEPSSDFETIAPANLSMGATPDPTTVPAKVSWLAQSRAYLFAGLLLLLLLLAVIFILPDLVPTIEPRTTVSPVSSTGQTSQPVKPLESPWTEAQVARQRLAAQEILAELLKKQTSLEDKRVLQWAGDEFRAAMDVASQGDGFYRQREFEQAQAQYHQANALFDELLETATGVFEQALISGQEALDQENAATALADFGLALDIDNSHPAAQTGLRRAEVLEELLALWDQGQALEEQRQFEDARALYIEARDLDEASEKINQAIVNVRQKILERDFSQAMSKGYVALQKQQYSSANKAFDQAGKLKPGSSLVKDAKIQVENQQTQEQINGFLAKGQQYEKQEEWQLASDWYNKALAVDKTLVTARIGQIRSGARANLDQQLKVAIEKPARLMNQAVYQQTKQLYQDAMGIKRVGPRLIQQRQQLASLLKDALLDIPVTMASDNLTEVTLYKVGKLGQFVNKQLVLKPGNYTVVGSRDGYRDVRREFTVAPRQPQQRIEIRCQEKISNG